MYAICQHTMSTGGVCCTTNNGDWFERFDETHCHMKPAVVPETMNLTP